MDIWTVLKACIRRWYVFLPILGAALWIGNVQVQNAPPVYTATSSAALTGPALVPGTEPGEIIEVNPFQNLGGSMANTTDIAVSLMDSGPKRDQFAGQGITADYEVSSDGSVIYFDVTGNDATQVTEQAALLVTALDTEVATLQNKPVEAPESRIRAVPIALPTLADKDTMAGLQMLAVIAVLGLVLATVAALIVEGIAASRARAAARRRADAIAATSWAEPTDRLAAGGVPALTAGTRDGVTRDRSDRLVHDGKPREAQTARAAKPLEADERAEDVAEDPAASPFEPEADTVVIADGPVAAARHGRRA